MHGDNRYTPGMTRPVHRLALTCGEPAGIGPDLCLRACHDLPVETVILGNRELFSARAAELGVTFDLPDYDPSRPPRANHSCLLDLPLPVTCQTGIVDPANAGFVLDLLRRATTGCLSGEFAALVTAPLHKENINNAGIPFTGHTEFLAELCDIEKPVMMLATNNNGGLRVALATTHLPLRDVADHITPASLRQVIAILHRDLQQHFGIASPLILVCGLNPHAGEGGHLGREEIEIISPVLDDFRQQGMNLVGPLPADTLFTPAKLAQADAVLAMYHDQGLPVLKHMGFGNAVNITLGLPIIRTSVDHGTALELAGTGKADAGSLHAALETAVAMINATCDRESS